LHEESCVGRADVHSAGPVRHMQLDCMPFIIHAKHLQNGWGLPCVGSPPEPPGGCRAHMLICSEGCHLRSHSTVRRPVQGLQERPFALPRERLGRNFRHAPQSAPIRAGQGREEYHLRWSIIWSGWRCGSQLSCWRGWRAQSGAGPHTCRPRAAAACSLRNAACLSRAARGRTEAWGPQHAFTCRRTVPLAGATPACQVGPGPGGLVASQRGARLYGLSAVGGERLLMGRRRAWGLSGEARITFCEASVANCWGGVEASSNVGGTVAVGGQSSGEAPLVWYALLDTALSEGRLAGALHGPVRAAAGAQLPLPCRLARGLRRGGLPGRQLPALLAARGLSWWPAGGRSPCRSAAGESCTLWRPLQRDWRAVQRLWRGAAYWCRCSSGEGPPAGSGHLRRRAAYRERGRAREQSACSWL
jgi:hypothetical protein